MSLLEKSSSIELSRRTQPFYAKKQSYNLGEQVQIEVDLQREFIDFENSRMFSNLHFTANTTAADTRTIPWVASAMIKNLRVKTLAGQMIGHEIREYRAWCRMYKELAGNSDKNESYDDILEGATPTNQADAAYVFKYGHKFMSHIFTIKEYYPAHFHQGIMIEFDLPSTALELFTATETVPVGTTVTIQDIRYVADLVQLKPEIENEMVKMMEEQRLFADYQEVLTQENTLSGSASGLKAFDVVGIDGRVKGIFTYQIQQDLRIGTGAAQLGDYFGNKRHYNIQNYRYKLGANYLNYQSIEIATAGNGNLSAEQLYELAKALDFHDSKMWSMKAGDSELDRAALTGRGGNSLDNLVQAVKVDKAQKNSDSVISSMIDKDRNNVRIELTYHTAPPGTDLTSFTHVSLDKRIQILPGSIVRNVRS